MKKLFIYLDEIWNILNLKMRYNLFLILFLIIINAIGELFSIVSIKAIIGNLIIGNNVTDQSLNLFIWQVNNQNIIFISALLIISLLTVLSLKVINLFFITRFCGKTGTLIASRIFSGSVLSKYYNFDNFNNNYITSSLTNQLGATVTGLINIFRLFSSLIICFFILSGLLINNFKFNILVISFFIIIYLLSYKLIKNKLKNNSSIIKKKSQDTLKVIQDGLGASKEILVNNLQYYFRNLLAGDDWPLRKAKGDNYVIKILPRSIIEFFAYFLIIIICLFSRINKTDSVFILSFVGSLSFAIQRLMPQMQSIFAAWSYLTGEKASIINVLNLMKKYRNTNIIKNNKSSLNVKNIEFDDIYFKYQKRNKYLFERLNIKIFKGNKIGVVGQSGSGKSTLIDLITGTIIPSKGLVKVNNKNIHNDDEFLFKWRNSFTIITQKPYFFNSTILENIAIGEKFEDINSKRVYESAKKAMIFEFIDSLEHKFLTKIGDNGSKLSGGQAQRISIARAIYKNKKILIMDEATSALDEKTEDEIIKSLRNISSDMTLIIISHRKSILKLCDKIIKLN